MSIKSLARRFLAWIGHPVALPRMPVTTKPTSMHEAELMLTALVQLSSMVADRQHTYMCIALACATHTSGAERFVAQQLRDDIARSLNGAACVERLICDWFWYEPRWSDSEIHELAKQVRLRWIDETIDAVVDYMLEQTAPSQPLTDSTAAAQE